MKKLFWIGILMAGLVGAGAQPRIGPSKQGEAAAQADLPRFDLDFPGGPPRELVAALNQPLNGTLNVIIPEESNDVEIPALKMKSVNVAQVFQALQRASMKNVTVKTGNARQQWNQSYDFSTTSPITENSVWSFNVIRPPAQSEERAYRFYQLGPYLDGLKIEDIITAIQTAWKMLGAEPGPTLKFHPETKLLIAVGRESEFQLIDDVLKELGKGAAKPVRLSEVLVNGEVNKPGNIQLPKDQKLTVLDAIGRAGGLKVGANPSKIKFARPGQGERIITFDDLKKENDPAKIIYLEPGDVVDVSAKFQ